MDNLPKAETLHPAEESDTVVLITAWRQSAVEFGFGGDHEYEQHRSAIVESLRAGVPVENVRTEMAKLFDYETRTDGLNQTKDSHQNVLRRVGASLDRAALWLESRERQLAIVELAKTVFDLQSLGFDDLLQVITSLLPGKIKIEVLDQAMVDPVDY